MDFVPHNPVITPELYWEPAFGANQGSNLSFPPRTPYQENQDILWQLFTPSPSRGLTPPSPNGISDGLLYQSFAPFSTSQSWITSSASLPHSQFRSSFPPLPPNHTTSVDNFSFDIPQQNIYDEEAQGIETLETQPSFQEPHPKRPRKNISEWDKHKMQIKKFYLDEGKSVEETRDCMSEQFDFNASAGAYKTKFNQWGFVKNLSRDRANWMLVKASRRKEEENKDTVFDIGDRTFTVERVQQSLKRTRTDRDSGGPERITSSPQDIRCRTPLVPVASPRRSFMPSAQQPYVRGFAPMPPPQLPSLRNLRLPWDVCSSADMQRNAQELDQQGKFEEAEKAYHETLNSLERMYPPTHQEITAAVYELADFYARNSRMDDADNVLIQLREKHVKAFGKAHPKTVEHTLRVLKLFEDWSRTDDASAQFSQVVKSVKSLLPDSIESLDADDEVAELQDDTIENIMASSDQLDRGGRRLGILSEGMKQLLPRVIEECERRSDQLSVQSIEIRSLHLDICRYLEDNERLTSSLKQAGDTIRQALCSSEPIRSSLLQPLFGLISRFVRKDYLQTANKLFRDMERLYMKRTDGANKDAICFVVGVGKLFENRSWEMARTCFERALAATMALHAESCECVKLLENTLSEKKLGASLEADSFGN